MGSRLLRVNILSPITCVYRASEIDLVSAIDWSIDHKAIEARLDVVAGKFLFHEHLSRTNQQQSSFSTKTGSPMFAELWSCWTRWTLINWSSRSDDYTLVQASWLIYLDWQLASSETRPTTTAKGASARVSQMLSLRNLVRNLPSLKRALSGSQSQLLQVVHEVGLCPQL